ncbi:nitronate monooxygenase [Salmonella enterica]|nr:nitronate monooxygenase [Salmonella enterica]
MKYNRICQILGIEKPVIQGPLSWLTDARLVAAVSNAGGLGVLGPNAGLTAETAVSTPEETAEKMREEIRKTKKLTEKPFGVNLIPTPENDIWTPPILQVIKEEGVKAVVYTGYGEGAIITSLFNELKASGIAMWTSAGVYMATTLGVSTLDLLPWAIQCYAAIFFALIYGFSGIGIARTASASEKSPQASVTK